MPPLSYISLCCTPFCAGQNAYTRAGRRGSLMPDLLGRNKRVQIFPKLFAGWCSAAGNQPLFCPIVRFNRAPNVVATNRTDMSTKAHKFIYQRLFFLISIQTDGRSPLWIHVSHSSLCYRSVGAATRHVLLAFFRERNLSNVNSAKHHALHHRK